MHPASSAQADPRYHAASPPAANLGMRGGLGKHLLIAFLLLATIPLALLAYLTYRQVQSDSSQKVLASLETAAALKEANLVNWVESHQRELGLLASTVAAW